MSIPNVTCDVTSNYSCWIKIGQELNMRWAYLMVPVEIMMCIFMAVGTFGNTLVLLVYSHRQQKTTANIFIMFLAGIDLFACVILHPYIIYKLFHGYDQTWSEFCKLFEFINHIILGLSGLALCLVAIDRYLAICHPVKYLLFDKHVAKAITTITVISVVGSLPILELYGATPTVEHVFSSTFVGFKCHYKLEYQNSTFLTTFGGCVLSLFMIEIVIMIILYKHVAVTAFRARRAVRPLSNAHILAGIKPTTSSNSENKELSKGTQSSDANNVTPGPSAHFSDNVVTIQTNIFKKTSIFSVETKIRNVKISQQPLSDDFSSDYRRNYSENRNFSSRLKAAKMLFFVTALYFLSWMPFFILRICESLSPNFWNDQSDTRLVIETMLNHVFYLNNAVNPIIYTLINKNFRLDCKKAFSKHCGIGRR